jgi:hypothetical protein
MKTSTCLAQFDRYMFASLVRYALLESLGGISDDIPVQILVLRHSRHSRHSRFVVCLANLRFPCAVELAGLTGFSNLMAATMSVISYVQTSP